jgi:hypothetical protein
MCWGEETVLNIAGKLIFILDFLALQRQNRTEEN